jgi:hypothetical protein
MTHAAADLAEVARWLEIPELLEFAQLCAAGDWIGGVHSAMAACKRDRLPWPRVRRFFDGVYCSYKKARNYGMGSPTIYAIGCAYYADPHLLSDDDDNVALE